jgi:uncharacterized Tic20 family protein
MRAVCSPPSYPFFMLRADSSREKEASRLMASTADTTQPTPQYVTLRPSLGERLLATTAHLLTLFSIPGIIATGIIWVVARKGTPYLRHHARQALRWQFITHLLVIALIGLCIFVILGAGFTNSGGQSADRSLNESYAATLVIILLIAVSGTIFALAAVIGAIPALLSRRYRYVPTNRRSRRASPSTGTSPSAASTSALPGPPTPSSPSGPIDTPHG